MNRHTPPAPSNLEGEMITTANTPPQSSVSYCFSVHPNSPSKLEGGRGSVLKMGVTLASPKLLRLGNEKKSKLSFFISLDFS